MASKMISAELLRGPEGDVIYMEAGGDFVDELLCVLRAPVGAVMRCSMGSRSEGTPHSVMETLCQSVSALRGPLFNSGKSDAVPDAYDINAASASQGKQAFMKDTTKFIITRKLEVFESSSIRALTLLGAEGAALASLATEEVSITTEDLRRLIGHALLNTGDVLGATFPPPRGSKRSRT